MTRIVQPSAIALKVVRKYADEMNKLRNKREKLREKLDENDEQMRVASDKWDKAVTKYWKIK